MHEQLTTAVEDRETLQNLGRACAEIVHDTRNELNALKLYATFLIRRSEKNNWMADERETLAKILIGLERGASGLGLLSRYSRPIEPAKRAGVDLLEIVQSLPVDPGLEGRPAEAILVESEPGTFSGNFDPVLIKEALLAITLCVIKLQSQRGCSGPIKIRSRLEPADPGIHMAVTEWEGEGFRTGDLLADAIGGITGVRIALAAAIVAAHQGTVTSRFGSLSVALPIAQ